MRFRRKNNECIAEGAKSAHMYGDEAALEFCVKRDCEVRVSNSCRINMEVIYSSVGDSAPP